MKNEKIYDAITQIPDEMIHEAMSVKLKKSKTAKLRFFAVAAAVLLVGISGFILTHWNKFNGSHEESADPLSSISTELEKSTNKNQTNNSETKNAVGGLDNDDKEKISVIGLSYNEVLSTLQEINTRNPYYFTDDMRMTSISDEAASDIADDFSSNKREMQASGAVAETGSQESYDNEYSDTNTQVGGVDEADIIKTDGEYIYRLRDNEVVILRADGTNTSIVSRIDAAKEIFEGEEGYSLEIYLSGERLVVLRSFYGGVSRYYDEPISDNQATEDFAYYSQMYIMASIYDVSDKLNPVLVGEVGQDGDYSSSRLVDGVLYLVSNYSVYTLSQPEKPETYVPCLIENNMFRAIAAEDIRIGAKPEAPNYVVVSAISVEKSEILSSTSVLGGAARIYMSMDNLYVSRSFYDVIEGESFIEDNYTVQAFEEKSRTELLKFSLDDGNIQMDSFANVEGTLLNQFSMDEQDGYLRVVTTTNDYSYTMYTDEKHDWINYEFGDENPANALFILSPELSVVGSIENLAPGERVYSVRFDGEIGYFVTFRQVDPLFAVNLSDPVNPTVMSELKIPGFSQYLHVFDPGHLFGLGMDADEDTGITGSMKLSMFDISDPYDITQKHVLLLEENYSTALYNHKAILVSAERNLIAFPSEKGYSIYGYSGETGFYLKGQINIDMDWNYYDDVRGLYINDYFYVVSSGSVNVFLLDDFSHVCKISIE